MSYISEANAYIIKVLSSHETHKKLNGFRDLCVWRKFQRQKHI